MPEIIATTVYRLNELSRRAKESARSWYRDRALDNDWHEQVYSDFEEIAEIVGIRIKTRAANSGRVRTDDKPRIFFSGFSSQGDGACFEALYSYEKGASKRIRAHAPKDVTLHEIADRLTSIQRRNFYQLRAETTHRGRYYHAYSMDICVERDNTTAQVSEEAERIVAEALRDLANWLYSELEREYDFLTSDDAIDEVIIANAFTFTEAGQRFG